jgi:hypothetical protein
MTEIKTTGINGIRNRIIVFNHFRKDDVIEVNANLPVSVSGCNLAITRVILNFQTIQLMYTGQSLSVSQIRKTLSIIGENPITEKELSERTKKFAPEFNTGTQRIGKGYRAIANTVMLTARADFYSIYSCDLFPYEYNELLMANSAISEELNK